jgi:hypothetical protein
MLDCDVVDEPGLAQLAVVDHVDPAPDLLPHDVPDRLPESNSAMARPSGSWYRMVAGARSWAVRWRILWPGGVDMKAALTMADFVGEVRKRCEGALDPAEMGRFLGAIRIEPTSVDGFVRFAPGRYTRHLVHKDRDVEILVLCWARGSSAPIHGHEGEYCWAQVERGRLLFASYRETSRVPLRLEPLASTVEGGPGHVDGPADIHAVTNPVLLAADAVSVHVYCRPYDECDIYDVEQGVVRRVRLSYDSIPPHLTALAAGQLSSPARA